MVATISIEELLAREAIGASDDKTHLSKCLMIALGGLPGKKFRYLAPLRGRDRSIRIFGQEPFEDSVDFPQPFGPTELAAELMRLTGSQEARYPPRGILESPGWAILTLDETDSGGNRLTVAYTKWISRIIPV